MPVYWPILVFYFLIVFVASMKRQIQHMIRYRYIPFDFGKVNWDRLMGTGPAVNDGGRRKKVWDEAAPITNPMPPPQTIGTLRSVKAKD